MLHTCKALVIHCMDFRFHTAIRDFLVSQGLKDQYDLVSLAGATKGIVEKDISSTEIILKQIEISQRLHCISEVFIMHHMDCGAYGGHKAFDCSQTEHDKQIADMTFTKKIISEKFPKLQVRNILARIAEKDGHNEIDFEVI
jgi:carbonic anhydrase